MFDHDVDKRICQLPPLRVSEPLEQVLMRLAAAEDRKLSDYVHLVLHRHCFGRAPMVNTHGTEGKA
jgi:hypothetical protein